MNFSPFSCDKKLPLIMILSDELWMIDEASLVTFTHNSWNFENNLLLHSTPFTPDNNLPQSHARGFLKNPTTPEIPRDNPNGTPGILP